MDYGPQNDPEISSSWLVCITLVIVTFVAFVWGLYQIYKWLVS